MEFQIQRILTPSDSTVSSAIKPSSNPSQRWSVTGPSTQVSEIKERFGRALQAAEKIYNYGALVSLKTKVSEEEIEAEMKALLPQQTSLENSSSEISSQKEESLLRNTKQETYGTFN